MYVCVCMCVYIYMYVFISISIYIYIYIVGTSQSRSSFACYAHFLHSSWPFPETNSGKLGWAPSHFLFQVSLLVSSELLICFIIINTSCIVIIVIIIIVIYYCYYYPFIICIIIIVIVIIIIIIIVNRVFAVCLQRLFMYGFYHHFNNLHFKQLLGITDLPIPISSVLFVSS